MKGNYLSLTREHVLHQMMRLCTTCSLSNDLWRKITVLLKSNFCFSKGVWRVGGVINKLQSKFQSSSSGSSFTSEMWADKSPLPLSAVHETWLQKQQLWKTKQTNEMPFCFTSSVPASRNHMSKAKSSQCCQSSSLSLLWLRTQSVLLSSSTSKEMSFPSWAELVMMLSGLLRLRYIMVWMEVRSSHSSSHDPAGSSQRAREFPFRETSTRSPQTA